MKPYGKSYLAKVLAITALISAPGTADAKYKSGRVDSVPVCLIEKPLLWYIAYDYGIDYGQRKVDAASYFNWFEIYNVNVSEHCETARVWVAFETRDEYDRVWGREIRELGLKLNPLTANGNVVKNYRVLSRNILTPNDGKPLPELLNPFEATLELLLKQRPGSEDTPGTYVPSGPS